MSGSNGNGKAPAPARHLALTAASTITVRPVHWLWEGRLALGTLCLIGGREGVGKSIISYTLASNITRGTLPGVYLGTPKAVIVAASEDSWEHTIVPRLMAAGADLAKVFRVDVHKADGAAATLQLPVDIAELKRVMLESQAALILLDPLLSRIATDLDTHKDADVRVALEPIVALADETHAAIIGLIHVNKSASTDPLTLLMGSRAFAAVARSVLFVMEDPQDKTKRLLGQAKNNLGNIDLATLSFRIIGVKVANTPEGEVWTGHLEWLGDSPQSLAEAIAAGNGSPEDQNAVSEAVDWLVDYLVAAGGPCESAKAKRAGQQAGHSVRSLQRAITVGRFTVTKAGFPSRSFWALPVAPADLGATDGNYSIF